MISKSSSKIPPAKKCPRTQKSEDHGYLSQRDAMCQAMCNLSPIPQPVQGRPRCLVIYSLPLNHGEPQILRHIKGLAHRLGINSNEIIEPFHQGYARTRLQEQVTKRIQEMLCHHRLRDRFDCSRFSYMFSQGTLAIGLADGRPSRTYNTLTGAYLLYTDYHPDNLGAMAKISPDNYTHLAMQYIGQQRLSSPQSELPSDDTFPGVTIMSDLLPATFDDQLMKSERSESPAPMTRSKSSGMTAIVTKSQTRRPITLKRPICPPTVAPCDPPAPPPPPLHAIEDTKIKHADISTIPAVPPPPKPNHERANVAGRAAPKNFTWKPKPWAQDSWNKNVQNEWQSQSSQWSDA